MQLASILKTVLVLCAFYTPSISQETPIVPELVAHLGDTIRVRNNPNYDGHVLKIPISSDGSVTMHQRWMEQAYSGLFTALALKKIPSLSVKMRNELTKCSQSSYDVIQHANCLRNIIEYSKNEKFNKINEKDSIIQSKTNRNKIYQKGPIINTISVRLAKYRDSGKLQDKKSRRLKLFSHRHKRSINEETNEKKNSILHRRKITRTHYELLDPQSNGGLSPLGSVAKLLTTSMLQSKNKTQIKNWQVTINKIQKIILKRREREKKLKTESKRHIMPDVYNKTMYDDSTYVSFHGLKEHEIDALEDPNRIDNFLTAAKRQHNDDGADTAARISSLVREGVRVGFAAAGANTTDFDRKTLKLVSPRFLSIVPESTDDDNSTINLLSPSLFSMHDEGDGLERAASIGALSSKFGNADRTAWLNLVMEAAGVNDHAERLEKMENENASEVKLPPLNKDILKKAYENETRGEDGQPLYFTKQNVTERFGDFERRKIETFERLIHTYSKEQLSELNTTGYTLLKPNQLQLLYGSDSPYNNSATLQRLLTLKNETRMHDAMERNVLLTAEMRSFQVRQKDIALSPIVLSPLISAWPAINQLIVLSPLVLSPIILTPAVLGPAVLSPFVFTPIILSPRVLAPLILNPLVFIPVILSPLVLHPFILTPGVFVPFILTPFVLSPLILSPQVFTPIILSPLVLSPLILNPMVGSPLVLSPFVLSPLILSPQALFAVVLSPYALSPLVESKLIASALVLSPSWLS